MRFKCYASLLFKINPLCTNCKYLSSHVPVLIKWNRNFSQWNIVGAVCLERKPVLTQPLNSLEEKYMQYIQKLEVEKSYLSDHEKRHQEDTRNAKKFKEGTLEDLDLVAKQTAQDFEDACLKDFEKYKPAPRITEADSRNDRHSTWRKLDSSLVLVINEKLGNEFKWVLPQAIHKDGETLRQTAERALFEVAKCQSRIKFMGNAPVGYYKYKYPKAIRGNGACGAKVFFFKAQLLNPKEDALVVPATERVMDYMWLTHSELKDALVPVLCKTVQSFLFPDNIMDDNSESVLQIDKEEQMSSLVGNQG